MGAFVASAVPAFSGCTTHQCDASTEYFDGGEMVTADTYETSPLAGGWISFGPNVTLVVDYSKVVPPNLEPFEPISYISVDQNPLESDAGFITGVNNLALFQSFSSTGFTVTNGTCAPYFARFVVGFEPLDGAASAADTGEDGGAE